MVAHAKIHVGPGGTLEPKGDFSTSPTDINQLLSELTGTSQSSLTIHCHGGLVSESKGVEVADMMASVYEAAGNYPVAFIWETSLIETFRDNLADLIGPEKIQGTLLSMQHPQPKSWPGPRYWLAQLIDYRWRR